MPCSLPRRIERVRVSITSPLVQPSPNGRRVGIRIVTFGACSGFTHVTARRIAQPPKATFVTRLQPMQLPAQAARQLPDQSTTLRVESSSTDVPRLRGALPMSDKVPPIPRVLVELAARRVEIGTTFGRWALTPASVAMLSASLVAPSPHRYAARFPVGRHPRVPCIHIRKSALDWAARIRLRLSWRR